MLLTNQVQIKGSHDFLLGFVHLLELTELRKTVHLPDYQFITKGHNPEQPDEEMHRASYGEGMHGLSLCATSPHLGVLTNLEASQTHPFGDLWRLHYTGMTD